MLKPLVLVASFAALAATAPAQAQDTIKIGEINSYKAQPAFLDPYKKGGELGVEEVNAAGGVLGKKIEVVSRDDNGNPGDAVRVAEELVSREGVALIAGGFLSNTGLAVTDFAKQKKVFFLAAEPLTDKVTWQNGNHYTFRLRPNTYMQVAMLVPEAGQAEEEEVLVVGLPRTTRVRPVGRDAATFKAMLKKLQLLDVEFLPDQATPLGRIEAGAVVQALSDAPNPTPSSTSCSALTSRSSCAEGNTRELFKGRDVVSLLTGEPEYLEPLKEEAPDGWIVTGYPYYGIQTPEHKKFFLRLRFRSTTSTCRARLGVVGYSTIISIAEGIKEGQVDRHREAGRRLQRPARSCRRSAR